MQSPYAHEMKINILRSQIKTHKKFLAVTKFLCWLQLGLSAWMAAFAIIYLHQQSQRHQAKSDGQRLEVLVEEGQTCYSLCASRYALLITLKEIGTPSTNSVDLYTKPSWTTPNSTHT